METTELPVVADAGPIIHLDELGCLDLLADFAQVSIPREVWGEVVQHRPLLIPSAVPNGRVFDDACVPRARLLALSRSLGLDVGETSALALMETSTARLLLCDDAAARLAAESLGYGVRGTIGILVRSIRKQRRTREQVLEILRNLPDRSSLFISRNLLAEVIAAVEGQARG